MQNFMDKDFLLDTETAKKLYHEHAEKMPIIDYHCHLQPKEIFEDKKFRNLAEAWLGAGDRYGDHYKWRALRARGYQEDSISGPDDDKKKYMQFVESMPYFVGNPLYHWSHLEMQRYFDIHDIINKKNADKIWDKANQTLETLTAREMMYKFNVKTVCTTDDPVDSLEWHKKMNEDETLKVTVRPAFRPDKAINVELSWFESWVNQLASVCNTTITSLQDLLDLSNKHKKIGLSEERVTAMIPEARKYIAFWRDYPDLFIDFMAQGTTFELFYYQRVFLRGVIRHKYFYGVFPRAYSKSFLSMLILMIRCILYPGAKLFVTSGGKIKLS